MSEVPFSNIVWEKEREDAGAMESCYKLYTWINQTVLMLLFQIFWKVSQISDFFNGKWVLHHDLLMITKLLLHNLLPSLVEHNINLFLNSEISVNCFYLLLYLPISLQLNEHGTSRYADVINNFSPPIQKVS